MMLEILHSRYNIFNCRHIVCLLGFLCLTAAGHVQAQFVQEDWSEMFIGELLASIAPKPPLVQAIAEPEKHTTPAETAEVASSPEQNSQRITQNSRTVMERELWRTRIGTLPESQVNQPKEELEKIIQLVSSIEIKQQVVAASPEPDTEADVEKQPQSIPEEKDRPDQPDIQTENEQPEVAAEQISSYFREVSESPETLIDPLKLADALFKGGYLEESSICYQEALRRLSAQESDVFQDKVWVLLQMGNCLKQTDPQRALENYQRVVAEYPYSPWAQLAKEKSDVVSWYLKDNPKKLMQDARVGMSQ